MSLKSQIESHASSVFLNANHFAQEVTHYPSGVIADAATVTADFQEQPSDDVRDRNSRKIDRFALLTVSASLTVDRRDQWLIDGYTWQTVDVPHAESGLRVLELKRTGKIRS